MLSKKNNDMLLVRLYWWFGFLVTVIYIVFVSALVFIGFANKIWIGQSKLDIYLSVIWGIIIFYNSIGIKYIDAIRLTKRGEIIKSIQLLISLLVFGLVFYLFDMINISVFFIIQITLQIMLLVGFKIVLNYNGFKLIPKIKLDKENILPYIKNFWDYSNPLILLSILVLLGSVGQRWILQRYAGSIQQGYFGVSFKIGAFIFLFTSSIIPLLTREFSTLHSKKDLTTISEVFLISFKSFYFIAAIIGVFISFHSSFILSLFAGNEYNKAVGIITVMAFYPIHQTLGQLNGTLFYSTNRTSQYRNIGIIFVPISLILSYILITPRENMGLGFGLGALGLAYQMVFLQVVSVNTFLYFNSIYLKINYIKLLIYQVITLIVIVTISYINNYIIQQLISNNYLETFIEFLLFIVITFVLGYRVTYFTGVSRDKVNKIIFSIFLK